MSPPQVPSRTSERAALPRTLCLALAISAALVICACGSSSNGVASKSAKEILNEAKAAADQADSVHVDSHASVGPLSLGLTMDYASNGAQGQIALAGLSFQVARIGDTLYFKGNRSFTANLQRATHVHIPEGKWIKTPLSGSKFAELAAFTEKTPQLNRVLNSGAELAKGSTTKIGGQEAIELKQKGKLYSGVLYVATTGKAYPLKIEKSGREHGQTLFSNWDKSITLAPPPGAVELPKS
jgi:hypothetical protein